MPSKLGLSVALTADPSAFEKGLKDALKVTQTAGKSLEKEAQTMVDGFMAQLKKIGNQSTMRGAIRQMENLAGQMQRMGLEGSKAFSEVIRQTGALKAEQSDLKDLIDASRPDAPFKALGNTLKASANAMAGLQGAMALVGGQSEEMQQAMLKVQGAMALAMSTEAIDQFSDAFKQLNTVISANPLIAVAAGFVAVAAAVYSVYDALDAQGKIEENYHTIQKKTYENSAKEISQLDTLTATVQDETLSREKRQAALDALNRLYPDTFKNYSLEKTSNQEIAAAHDLVSQAILRKAKVAAAEEMLTDIYKKQFEQAQRVADGNLSMLGTMMQLAGGGAAGLQFEIQKYGAYQKQAQALTQVIKGLTTVQDLQGIKPATTTATTKAAPKKDTLTREGILPVYGIKPQGIDSAVKMAQGQFVQLDDSLQKGTFSAERQAAALKELQTVYVDFSQTLSTAVTGSLTDVASAMGTAMASGQDLGEVMGKVMLNALAGFMKQMGEMFIAAGVAKLAFDQAMIKVGGAPLAIAAGAALVAASSAMTANLQKANEPARFATGGIVGGNSFMGDRVPALLNSGEMVLNKQQQSNLFAIANGNTKAGTVRVTGETIVRGRDIVIAFKNAERDYNRG